MATLDDYYAAQQALATWPSQAELEAQQALATWPAQAAAPAPAPSADPFSPQNRLEVSLPGGPRMAREFLPGSTNIYRDENGVIQNLRSSEDAAGPGAPAARGAAFPMSGLAARYAESQRPGGAKLDDPFGIAAAAYSQAVTAAEMRAYQMADHLSQFLPPQRVASEVRRLTGVDLSDRLASTPNMLKREETQAGIEDKRTQSAGRRQEQAAKDYEANVQAPAQAAGKLDSLMTDLGAIEEQAGRLKLDPNLAGAVGPIQGRVMSFGKGSATFDAGLESLKSQISQMALAAMRDASKTGGAVGNVTVEEWKKLADTVASLDQSQGEASMRASLDAVSKRAGQLKARAAESTAAQYGERQLPVAARNQVPEGKFKVFENGQVWTRENGTLKRVR